MQIRRSRDGYHIPEPEPLLLHHQPLRFEPPATTARPNRDGRCVSSTATAFIQHPRLRPAMQEIIMRLLALAGAFGLALAATGPFTTQADAHPSATP